MPVGCSPMAVPGCQSPALKRPAIGYWPLPTVLHVYLHQSARQHPTSITFAIFQAFYIGILRAGTSPGGAAPRLEFFQVPCGICRRERVQTNLGKVPGSYHTRPAVSSGIQASEPLDEIDVQPAGTLLDQFELRAGVQRVLEAGRIIRAVALAGHDLGGRDDAVASTAPGGVSDEQSMREEPASSTPESTAVANVAGPAQARPSGSTPCTGPRRTGTPAGLRPEREVIVPEEQRLEHASFGAGLDPVHSPGCGRTRGSSGY